LAVLKRNNLNIPFVTVVTDMVKGYHTWYDSRTTLCLVPTELARQQAEKYQLAADQLEVVGQPVALKFATNIKKNKIDLHCKMETDPSRPTILLIGGGEGFGHIFNIARNISQRVSQAQLIIVSGRNKSLKKKLTNINWEIPTRIFGFVDNMPELMNAADVLVSKAGPGCIAEAFVAGLPLILFDYIPGQEEANVHYVINNNAGVYVSDSKKIATLLAEWLTPNNSKLVEMTKNASRLARPNSALIIARRVYKQAGIHQDMSVREQLAKTNSKPAPQYGTGASPDSTLSPTPAASTNA
jgi:1,2-diacylglycerol 3-beta-galactosyltransferase